MATQRPQDGTTPDGEMSARARNKAAVRAEFAVWSGGDLARLDDLVASDVRHHDPYDPHALDGLAGLKRSITENRRLFTDLAVTVDDQVAEADRVATRWRARMVPARGPTVTIGGITIERFEHGKVVEAWRCMDRLGLLRGLGTLPGPAGT